MSPKNRIKLGEDGLYKLEDEETSAVETSVEGTSAEGTSAVETSVEGTPVKEAFDEEVPVEVVDFDPAMAVADASELRQAHLKTSISSSISGPGIGDDVAFKRANLLNAQGKPQIGRREPPEPYDPRPTQIMYAKGILAGLVVVIIVCAIVLLVGGEVTIS